MTNSRSFENRIIVLLIIFLAWAPSIAQDVDSDGDGLSDFQEQHKYLTDPQNKDSDGDGIEDGDWKERREFQYTIRSVVQVMRPVTIEYLNDDYQDARILDETETYVELEVFHYPINTVASTISAEVDWHGPAQNSSHALAKWLEPGPTSDWTPELRQEIKTAMKREGIDLEELSDLAMVETASQWLLKRTEFQDGFSCFSTAFDDNGKPYVPEDRKGQVGQGSKLTPEQQWEREISAAGMFRNQVRGSCSSSAIYLNGCLRALGVPTRTILCIPIIDANDESEIKMLHRLSQTSIRNGILEGILPLKGSWASHTYNEVFVGGRWRRLNYSRLGQNIYDPGMLGLMTHVATFHDWADAKMSDTIGRRQNSRGNSDVFGGPNPYSTISLRDEVGPHCKLKLPKAEVATLTVEKIQWTDSKDLPQAIRENCERRGRFGLIADVTGWKNREELSRFLAATDLRVFMQAMVDDQADEGETVPRLGVGFDSGCYWASNQLLRIYVPFGGGDRRDLKAGITYRFEPRNSSEFYQWQTAGELTIVRDPAEE